jgi:tetratricopeptide (TPR) repeat protein
MTTLVARVLMVLIVAFCGSVSAYAQLGSIFGRVIDKDGKPLAGATVMIERDEVKLRYEVKTDRNGIYQRMGVDDGTYRVSVVQSGNVVASDTVTVSLGARADKDVDLRNPRLASAGAAPVSKAQQEAEQRANAGTQGAYNTGLTALAAQNFDEAIKQFSLAAQRQPKMPIIFARLAEANAGARKNPEAVEAYKKAIELKGDEPGYRYQLGMLYIQANNMADAATQFERYLQLEPKGENANTAKQLLDAARATK